MSTTSVYDVHPEYAINRDYWVKANDVYNDLIKDKGVKYLPNPGSLPASISCKEDMIELNSYLEYKYKTEVLPMAVFYNFSNLTLSALVGAVMRKPPTISFAEGDAKSNLDYMVDNADGKGNGLSQLSRMLLGAVELFSRGGLLVDVPQMKNANDIVTGKSVPRLKFYDALNIIDWDTSYKDGVEVLSYLVLREKVRSDKDSNCMVEKLIKFYLKDGKCSYKIEIDGDLIQEADQIKDGKVADSIPFHLASSMNNDWDVDPSPMRTLVDLNLLHYIMLSRDMTGRYNLAQLQLAIDVGSGDTPIDDFKQLNPSGIMSGSSVPILTANGGSVNFLQANEANLLSVAPKEILDMATKAGAQLFESGGSTETATAAEIRSASSTATLSSVASNVGDCIYNALIECAEYLGSKFANPDLIQFSLNGDFFSSKLTAQEMQAYMQMVMQGVYPVKAMYETLRKSGDLNEDVTYEEYLNQLREDNGMGGMPNVSGDDE